MNFRIPNGRGIGTKILAQANLNDVPGPKAYPIVGVLPHYLPTIGKYNPQQYHKAGALKYKEFGPVINERLFSDSILYIYDPNDIETVVRTKGNAYPKRVTHRILEYVRLHERKEYHHNGGMLMTNGEPWAKMRTSFQKSISLDEVSRFIPVVDELITELVGKINEDSLKPHVETDFLNVIFSYSCDYMGLTMFGEKWNSLATFFDPNSISTRLIFASTELNHATGTTDFGARTWRWFSTPLYRKIRDCAKILDDLAIERLNSRIQNNQLFARDEDTLLDAWIRSGKSDYKQLLTFIADSVLAGIDTIAYTLTFAIYHLSENAEPQEKLYQELCSLDPTMKTPISSDILAQASYMKKAVKEAMRLNPLSIGVGRVLTEEAVLGGYLIPEETLVVTMNQVTSRLPEYVEFPDAFIPERYDLDGKFKRLHPFTSIPFGHGSRACIGRRLAEQNMYMFLFRLFRQYHVKWIGPKPLDCITSLINKPDAPLLFKFTPRTH